MIHRGLLYGDACFTTILVTDSRAAFIDLHLARLSHDCKTLNLQVRTDLQTAINTAAQKLQHGILRIQVSRQQSSRGYRPTHDAKAIVEIESTPIKPGTLFTEQPKSLCVALSREKPAFINSLEGVKNANMLDMIRAWQLVESKVAPDQIIDEILLSSGYGEWVEASSANLMIEKSGVLYLPKYHPKVSGVGITQVKRLAKQHNLAMKQTAFSLQKLLTADAIYLVNAVRGIRWVEKLYDHETLIYQKSTPSAMLQKLHGLFVDSI